MFQSESLHFNKEQPPQPISNFGEFSVLPLNQQRQLLSGSGHGAPGNQGAYLSKREIIALKECLNISTLPIRSEQEIRQEYERVYGKEFQIQSHKDKNISPCMRYMWKKATKKFEVTHLKDELRTFIGNLQYQEIADDEKRKKMDHVIHFLRQRDTKGNIQRMQNEFDNIQSQMTGKQPVVSMNQINKQLERIKKEDMEAQAKLVEKVRKVGHHLLEQKSDAEKGNNKKGKNKKKEK